MKTLPLALLSLIAAACVTNPVKRDPPPMPFVGTKWMLVTERKVEGEQPYLEFGDGAVIRSHDYARAIADLEHIARSVA